MPKCALGKIIAQANLLKNALAVELCTFRDFEKKSISEKDFPKMQRESLDGKVGLLNPKIYSRHFHSTFRDLINPSVH